MWLFICTHKHTHSWQVFHHAPSSSFPAQQPEVCCSQESHSHTLQHKTNKEVHLKTSYSCRRQHLASDSRRMDSAFRVASRHVDVSDAVQLNQEQRGAGSLLNAAAPKQHDKCVGGMECGQTCTCTHTETRSHCGNRGGEAKIDELENRCRRIDS